MTLPLARAGVKILGTSPDSIDISEDRDKFGKLLKELKMKRKSTGLKEIKKNNVKLNFFQAQNMLRAYDEFSGYFNEDAKMDELERYHFVKEYFSKFVKKALKRHRKDTNTK